MTKYLAALLMFFVVWPSFAADPNGYTAKYECRAGGPNCNVDVAGLAQQACQQTITTGTTPTTDWSAINWSNNVICIEAGDHTDRGTLTLRSSGTSGTYKVLRYYRSSDNNDEPWNQSVGNRAIVSALRTGNKDYWLVHRLSFTQQRTTPHIFVENDSTSDHLIFSRLLGEGIGGSGDETIFRISGTDNWLQNSVARNCQVAKGRSYVAIGFGNATRVRIVNNETYDCAKGISTGFNSANDGVVVENNDVYVTPAFYTNCVGQDDPLGDCSKAKVLVGISSGGVSQAGASRYVHNRLWGIRWCDTSVSCSGGGAAGVAMGGGYDAPANWVLKLNNIIMDSAGGIINAVGSSSSSANHSTIGNIIYKIRPSNGAENGGIQFYAASGSVGNNVHEVYLNSFIDVQGSGWIEFGGVKNSDVRCNTVINSSPATSIASGSGTEMDSNVYYGTKGGGEAHRIVRTLNAWIKNTAYSAGAVVRPTIETGWAYMATQSGVSGPSAPAFCQSLGCVITDGGIVWKAIRAPYTFHRKLRTVVGGEPAVIPYAQVHTSAPEISGCPSTIGSRQGIGVNDDAIF